MTESTRWTWKKERKRNGNIQKGRGNHSNLTAKLFEVCRLHVDNSWKISFYNDNLVLSNGLIMWIGHSSSIRYDEEGLMLETSTFESLYGGQFTYQPSW